MKPVPKIDWEWSATNTAALLSVSPQRLAALVKMGLPKLARGRYDPRACVGWLLAESRGKGEPGDVHAKRKSLYDAQEAHKRLETFRLAGTLVEVEEAEHVITTLAGIYTSQLQGLAPRLAGLVAGLEDPAIIEERLDDEFRDLLRAVSDNVREFGDQYSNERQNSLPAPQPRRRGVGRPKKNPAA